MKKSGSQKSKSPSQLIDARIKELGDWLDIPSDVETEPRVLALVIANFQRLALKVLKDEPNSSGDQNIPKFRSLQGFFAL